MRIFTKLTTSSMILGAALAVSACHKSDDAANTADTNMTDLNTMDSSAGMTNDMSATDSMGNSGMAGEQRRVVEPDVSTLPCLRAASRRPSGRPGGLLACSLAIRRFTSARFPSTCRAASTTAACRAAEIG